MKVLCIALSGIGDALMFTPALSVLKKHLPGAQVDAMVMFHQVAEIYGSNKNIDTVHFINFLGQPKYRSLQEVLRLRRIKYDFSVNVYPSNRKEYNLISFLSGAKKRIASKYSNYSFANLDFLNTSLKREVMNRHNVLENFDLIRLIIPEANENELGPYEITLDMEHETFAQKYLIDNLLLDGFIVGIHAGSATFKGHINKRWAAAKYIELAKKLHEVYRVQILLFGTEHHLNQEIHKEIRGFSSIVETDKIMQTIALMERCHLFISNDTALMHIASAYKIPTVAVFGYTNFRELHPWMNSFAIVRKDLECSPCFYNSPKPVNCIYTGEEAFKCIREIEVDEVFSAAAKLIQEIPGNIKSRYHIE